jgi:hypothetical protein
MVQRLIVLMTSLVPRENIWAVFKKTQQKPPRACGVIRSWSRCDGGKFRPPAKNRVRFPVHAPGRKPRGLSGRLAHTSGPPPAS